MALSPPRDQGSTQIQSPYPPREGLHVPAASSSHVRPSSSAPMSVPHAATRKSPPPPLPPPRYIDTRRLHDGQELVHRLSEEENGSNGGSGSVRSGSSLLGGSSSSAKQYLGPQKSVDFSVDAHSNEGRGDSDEKDQRIPDLGAVVEYNKLQGERQMGHRSNERSSAAYDKQVLARIGGPSTPPRSAGALSSSGATGAEDPSSPKSFRDIGGSLRPLSGSDRRRSDAAESPRWPPSTLSPTVPNLHSPLSDSDTERRPWSRPAPSQSVNKPPMSEVISPRNREPEHNMSFDQDSTIPDDTPLSQLNINDKRPHSAEDTKIGQKRRAQSPPSATIDPSLRSSGDGERRENPHLARVHNQEPTSLASSASSNMQGGSYPSSYNFSAASSATSYSSQHPGSSSHPGQAQSQGQSDASQQPQQQEASGGQPIQPAQQQSQQQMGPPPLHRRAGSSGIARPPGVFICECCPKKPKKFDNEDELRAHEMEKQYFCQFCHNRFKNKNEAERHQNSLHLRRHSWSCAQLQSLEDAFHPTLSATNVSTTPTMGAQSPSPARLPSTSVTDTCGYCGTEFSNPPDWNTRVEHLNHIHKFGECNQSKKFFRADHFRQHLKHSHAGTSGRWTNMLENACMREEPPPQPPSHMPMGMSGPAPIPVGQIHHLQPHAQYAGQVIHQAQMQQFAIPHPQMQPPQMQPPQMLQPQMQQPQSSPSHVQQQHPQPQPQHMVLAMQPAPKMQQIAPPVLPSSAQSHPHPAQQAQGSAPGAPMTQQQAQEAAQQATAQANEQQQTQDQPTEDEARQSSLPTSELQAQVQDQQEHVDQ